MIRDPQIFLFDLVVCLADAIDLISPSLMSHHKHVAYIAYMISAELGQSLDDQKDIILAGALHDIGALSLAQRLDLLNFETDIQDRHAEYGARLISIFGPLAHLAPTIRHHHDSFDTLTQESNGNPVPLSSLILHLADRVAVCINKNEEILGQVPGIVARAKEKSGTQFAPVVVDAFLRIAEREYFWLDATSGSIFRILRQSARLKTVSLDMTQLNDLAMLYAKIIDFRSAFTATHSSGVAATSSYLSYLCGFSARESKIMRIAGYLHDLGKLAIPSEILEKTGKLTPTEFNVIRSHTYHGFRILDTIPNFETINQWGTFHHERLDGKGYPFHHTSETIPFGSRIMCVSDVFTALAEDRPYRSAMKKSEVVSILKTMQHAAALDGKIIDTLLNHFDEVDTIRHTAQLQSNQEYRTLFGE